MNGVILNDKGTEEVSSRDKTTVPSSSLRLLGIFEKTERDRILQKLKNSGLSIREIERATGISRGIVAKS